jgi:hypothetical protein
MLRKITVTLLPLLLFLTQPFSQTCYTISNRTNGNGNPATCGSPACSGNAKTGHIDVSFGAVCPAIIPTLQLVSVTSGALPNPFCFDPGNCISAGTVRYCFRGSNLPSSGFMTLRFTQGAAVWSCSYTVNGGVGTVLPVQLSHFEAVLRHDQVLLEWRTEQEFNNDHFDVERSNGDGTFHSIGTVAGQGNSYSPVDYHFTDAAPLRGINLYRLRQTDIDGRTAYSAVRKIDNRIMGVQIRQLFPNPGQEEVTLGIVTDSPALLYARIYSIAGKEVFHAQKRMTGGEEFWLLHYARLSPGLYQLVVTSDKGGMLAEKMLVR